MYDEKAAKELIQKGRDSLKGIGFTPELEGFESDQELKRPQPPLCKPAVTPVEEHIALTKDFDGILLKSNITDVIRDRHSSRVYTEGQISLAQLSYMLWATQGVKSIRGKAYATLRTVPCGGARHEFETYLVVQNVEGLKPGVYHYLPMEHSLEFLKSLDNMRDTITQTLCGQVWASKASVVFYWSIVNYRIEWRYGVGAHRPSMIDMGHVGQNLYLAATALGLGCCGIAAYEHYSTCELFDLDGDEEFIVYTLPVGTVRDSDIEAENAFYSFVDEQGL